MNKILKRPMFRKGGAVEEGIIKLATGGRAMYADGPGPALDPNDPLLKAAQRREALLTQYMGAPSDPKQDLYDLLISGGLNLVGGVGAGDGTLASVARSFKEPTEKFLAKRGPEEAYKRQIKMAAAQGAISAEDAKILLEKELAGKKEIAGIAAGAKSTSLAETIAEEERKKGKDAVVANNIGKYATEIQPKLASKYGNSQIGGIIEVDIMDPKKRKTFISKNKSKEGKIFYDAKLDQTVQLVRDPNGNLDFAIISETDKVTVPKVSTGKPSNTKTISKQTKPYTQEDYLKSAAENQKKIKKIITTPVDLENLPVDIQAIRSGRG